MTSSPRPDVDPLEEVLDALALMPLPDRTDAFSGRGVPRPSGRTYGGQLVAQGLVAAARTVDDTHDPREPHSLHAFFLRPGVAEEPVRYVVHRLRDGGSFSARRVEAYQGADLLVTATVSFQRGGRGLAHQDPMPPVPAPEDLTADDRPGFPRRPVELRYCEPLPTARERTASLTASHVWMRTRRPVPTADPLLHAALLAYVSDHTILEATLRPHGLAWGVPGVHGASLDHAVWFHRPARIDSWLLAAHTCPSTHDGRGLALGRLFTADGTLAATVAQEGLVLLRGR